MPDWSEGYEEKYNEILGDARGEDGRLNLSVSVDRKEDKVKTIEEVTHTIEQLNQLKKEAEENILDKDNDEYKTTLKIVIHTIYGFEQGLEAVKKVKFD